MSETRTTLAGVLNVWRGLVVSTSFKVAISSELVLVDGAQEGYSRHTSVEGYAANVGRQDDRVVEDPSFHESPEDREVLTDSSRELDTPPHCHGEDAEVEHE